MELKGGLVTLKELFSGDRKVRLIVAAGLLGMVLILVSQLLSAPKAGKEADAQSAELSSEAYARALEKRLDTLIGNIEGVGKAQVMITMESSSRMVYATEEKTSASSVQDESGAEKKKVQESSTGQSNVILVDMGSGVKQPLVTTRLEPQVKGVVVVCPGADNRLVGSRVTEVVTTALGVGANKVCVVKGGT